MMLSLHVKTSIAKKTVKICICMCIFITARVVRMYRFCLVCVSVWVPKLIISSLHHILHLPGGFGPIQACPSVLLSVRARVSVRSLLPIERIRSTPITNTAWACLPIPPPRRRAVRSSLELILVCSSKQLYNI